MSDLSELLLLGVSHKTAPVALRERLVLPAAHLEEFLGELAAAPAVREAVAISTCNRTEIYLATGDAVEAETAALGLLARRAEIRPTELSGSIYSRRNCEAARHLYRVTSGLESMVVGEHEIQGQVKRSYEAALEAEATGPLTNRLFRAALATGKRVRAETQIAAGRVSVSSVAVDLARETVGALDGRSALILGTGETGELIAAALADAGAQPVFVANRRRDRALDLARRFEGRAVGFEDLPDELESADIVLAATASPHAIVTPEDLELVMEIRADRPLLLIDIAVPRDIDPICADIPAVTLFDLDDIQELLARTRKVRRAEAHRAEAIIEEEIQAFARWLGSLEVLPTLTALREHARGIVDGVLAENAGRWESTSERDRERIEAVARTVMQRLLHEPTRQVRGAAGQSMHARLQLLRELFGLEDGDEAAAGGDVGVPPEAAPVHELPRRARGAEPRG